MCAELRLPADRRDTPSVPPFRGEALTLSAALRERLTRPGPGLLLFLLVLAAMIVASVSASRGIRQFSGAVETPIACDDFGYLRQAQLFRQAGLLRGLDTEIGDAVTRALIGALKASGLPPRGWQEPVAPHCHHYKPSVDKVVLQYPPGTGFLLAPWPEGQQSRIVARLSALFILAVLIAVMVRARSAWVPVLAAGLAVICFVTLGRFGWSMSIGPSVAFAFALGYIAAARLDFTDLQSGWRWHALAGLLLGLAADVRIPNLFMVAGFAACYGVEWLWRPSLRGLAAPMAFGAALIAGLMPVLAANWINAGGPFNTTYSAVDAAHPVLDWAVLQGGLRAFFVDMPLSGRTILLGAAPPVVLAIVLLRRFEMRAAMALLAAAVNLVSNVGYFVLHDPRAPYYPVPVAVFAASAATFALIGIARPGAAAAGWRRWRVIAGALCFAVICIAVARMSIPVSPLFRDATLHRAFDSRTIVWADLKTGFFNYFQGRQASKLPTVGAGGEDPIIAAAGRLGVTQVAVADSPRMAELVRRLQAEGRAAPAGRAYGDDVFIVCPVRMAGTQCPASAP